ncbi:hypothetical protein D046_8339A, partial [Vibrio parahaemolyticus V-223/04]
MVTVTVSSGPG